MWPHRLDYAAPQALPSLGFSRQEHWSGLPFPSPMRESEVAQSCPTLSDPMDCSAPGSSVHEIFQAGVLEWGAIGDPNSIPGSGRFSGEGIGYPLQYSGLENSVHGVAKSDIDTSEWFSLHFHFTWTCESGNEMFHSSHLPLVCSLSGIHLYPLWDECAFSTFQTLPRFSSL